MDQRYDVMRPGARAGAWPGWCAALCLLACDPLAAQTAPGEAPSEAPAIREMQRQQARERLLREQAEREPDVHLLAPEGMPQDAGLPDGESPCMRIDRIELAGEGAGAVAWVLEAASRRVDGVADPVAGRCLGTQGVDLVMRRMQGALVARGFVTSRVLAAPQDLSTGILRLVLLPGRVRDIRFTQDSGARAQARNAVPVSAGELLNLRDIEQALENFRRVPTVQAQVDILPAEPAPGEPPAQAGDSDLLIRWTQSSPARLVFSADNFGSRATGRRQGAATLFLDAPLQLNDLLYVTLQNDLGGGDAGDRGTWGRAAGYSLPWGHWLMGFSASRSRYHQTVAGDVEDYVYSGNTRQADIRLTRTLHRTALGKTAMTLRGWTRESFNFIDDLEMVSQRRRTAGWELSMKHRGSVGATALDLELTWRRGTGAWQALPAREEARGEGASRPGILGADAMYMAPFQVGGQRLRWSTTWRAQWSRTPLVPQDRFNIGCHCNVRGFDGEYGLQAQRGWLLRQELGGTWGTGDGPEVFAALDHGEVSGAGAEDLVGRRLTGAALGLRGAAGPVGYEVYIGAPVRKPERFQTASTVLRFSVNAAF